ncbi:HAD family hydrolase [Candidatus Woesearchaeota archaeon]|nr:HAD family hydrolase [Candidatus Woesearchaeota archaeon]
MIKTIFFDFDLTLVNSRAGAKATYRALWKLTNQKTSKRGFQKYVGSKFSDMINSLHKKSGIPKQKLINVYEEVYAANIPKMKFYGKTLLPKLKGIKIIILTNNHRKSVIKACRHFKIRYNLLVASEDMKKDEKKHDIIKKAMKSLKSSEAVYVGDHINDVIEAHKAGIKAVIVPTGVFKRMYIKKYHPDFMIPNLNKLIEIIEHD